MPAPNRIVNYICPAAYHQQISFTLGLSCMMLTWKAPVMMAAGHKTDLSLCYFQYPLFLLLQSLHMSSAVRTYVDVFTFAQECMLSCNMSSLIHAALCQGTDLVKSLNICCNTVVYTMETDVSRDIVETTVRKVRTPENGNVA